MFSQPQVPTVDSLDAQRRVAAGTQLIDVRTEAEYAQVHAKGAVLCPLDSLLKGIRHTADTNSPMLVICKSGARSAQAVRELMDLGFDVYNVDGGTLEWIATGGPVAEGISARHVTALKAQQLAQQGAVLVDVRAPGQYFTQHAEGAVNLPYDEDISHLQAAFSKDQPIYLLCNTGGRAGRAAQALTEAGWNAYVVAGGTSAWVATGGSTTSGH